MQILHVNLKICCGSAHTKEGPEGVKWELGLPIFALGKWDLGDWDWESQKQNWEWEPCLEIS